MRNALDTAVMTTVTFVPEESEQSALDLAIELPPDSRTEWDEIPVLNDPGRITVEESKKQRRRERDWPGDPAIDDNYRLSVVIEEDRFRVTTSMS